MRTRVWTLSIALGLVAFAAWAAIYGITMSESYPGDDGAASGALTNAGLLSTGTLRFGYCRYITPVCRPHP